MGHIIRACISAVFTLFAAAVPAQSQSLSEPVTVGWAEVRPLFYGDEDGNPAGFGIDLARLIAKRADITLSFRRFDTPEGMIRAQAAGEVDLLPAIAALPGLAERNIFSDPVAATSIRVFIRTEDTERLDPATMSGVRIAVPSVDLGRESDALLARNVRVEFPVGTPSIMELLRGKVDALIASDSVTVSDAHTMRLDHRIAAVGAPIRSFDRIIAINRSRGGLAGPINQAIAELEADGTLQRLRETTLVAVPAPEPEVLTAGVYHFPPYNIVSPDGTFTGFSVDTVRNIAEAAGQRIRFVEISREEWGAGPGPGRYDLIPQAGINDARRTRMDFTLPVDRTSFEVFVRAGEGDGISDLDSLRGRRVGVEAVNAGRRLAEGHGDLDIQIFNGHAALLTALLTGTVDAIIYPRLAILRQAELADVVGRIEEIAPPIHVIDRAIALRFGLGQVRERLNAVIPGYLASPENDKLRAEYFDPPVFWTTDRVQLLLIGIGALLVAMIAGFAAYIAYRRRQATLERYRFASELVDHIPLGILLISPEGQIEFANTEIRDITPDGHRTLAIGANYREAIKSLIDRGIIDKGERSDNEMLHQMTEVALKDGYRDEYLLGNGGAYVRTAKHISSDGILIMRQNVSEDRRIRRALQAERARLAAVMDAAQSGIVGLAEDGTVMIANAHARHILGGISDELPFGWPKNLRFLDAEDLSPLETSWSPINRARAGETLKAEMSILSRTETSEPRYVRISSTPVDQKVSRDIRVVVVIEDVSEQETNRQKVERSARLDALGQLTGGIAHDFNNLLATIDYSVQLAGAAQDPEKRAHYEGTALASVRRGADLTNRLLAFAKRQPGLAKSGFVKDLLTEFARLAKPTIEEAIEIDFVRDDEDLWVFCDVGQLENALLNLVLNARDAIMRSGKGGKIVVRVRGVAEIEADAVLRKERPGAYIAQGLDVDDQLEPGAKDDRLHRYAEFSVTDDGPGMDDEVKRRAIDPFFTTKASNSGTGLGLSMVYGFIQQSNGELRIHSEVDHGTTVRLLLPRGTPSGERESPVARLPSPSGAGQTILVVEDQMELLIIMEQIIESLGYLVLSARDAVTALEMLRTDDTIDLLLTDVVMPGGIGGFALAAKARAIRPGLAVIYMSGYTGFSEEEMGEVQAPLLQKPSPAKTLATAIQSVLRC